MTTQSINVFFRGSQNKRYTSLYSINFLVFITEVECLLCGTLIGVFKCLDEM